MADTLNTADAQAPFAVIARLLAEYPHDPDGFMRAARAALPGMSEGFVRDVADVLRGGDVWDGDQPRRRSQPGRAERASGSA
jgi:hypothetical protein